MRDNTNLKISVIGCGTMGAIHARNLAADPRVGHVALFDADLARAEAVASGFGPRDAASSVAQVDSVFDGDTPDAFVICSPAALHLDQLVTASRTGAYVFCEKPVASRYEQIAAKLDNLRPYNDRIQVGFNRRFDPHMADLKARLAAPETGKIEQLQVISRDHTPPTLDQLPNSAGLIAETMIHDFDTVRWLLSDEIRAVFCSGAALVNPAYADLGHVDTTTTILTGRGGQQVVVQNSWRAPNGYDQRVEALCEHTRLNVGNPRASAVTAEDRSGELSQPIKDDWSTRYVDAYRSEMSHFVETVARRAVTGPNLLDGIAASYLAEQCAASLASGKQVECEPPAL
ncbi:Gfo/Idh/MocA family oxidoreductase [Halovulum sp. GXIMD14794]